jgi:ppGpp synthetase/RelA/SpoT-type nucleotidyltranferase
MSAPSGYSKRQVDWAGRVWADFTLVSKDQQNARADSDRESLIEAGEVIEWWRRQHAYPLTKVNAKLRHYLAPHGRPQVTQRLKKWPTIIYKLQRHPTMRLSATQDIGGLRAVLQGPGGG